MFILNGSHLLRNGMITKQTSKRNLCFLFVILTNWHAGITILRMLLKEIQQPLAFFQYMFCPKLKKNLYLPACMIHFFLLTAAITRWYNPTINVSGKWAPAFFA